MRYHTCGPDETPIKADHRQLFFTNAQCQAIRTVPASVSIRVQYVKLQPPTRMIFCVKIGKTTVIIFPHSHSARLPCRVLRPPSLCRYINTHSHPPSNPPRCVGRKTKILLTFYLGIYIGTPERVRPTDWAFHVSQCRTTPGCSGGSHAWFVLVGSTGGARVPQG